MTDVPAEERRLYASVDAGFIGQNVYLFCASEGLGTVFRGAVDYQKLARAPAAPGSAVRNLRADGGISRVIDPPCGDQCGRNGVKLVAVGPGRA
jgi:nitroreductase